MDILQYWKQWMVAEDLSPRTISERIMFIERLQRENGDVREITRQTLISWTSEQDWSNATRVHYRSQLHTFFTWLQDEGFRLDNPAARLPKVRHRKRTPNPFTVEEIEQLLNCGVYHRTRVMIALHYYLGLRVSEIARVHGEDIDWNRRTLTTLGKGSKKAILPVPAELWSLLLKMPRDKFWFPNPTANELWPAGEGHVLGRSVSTSISKAIARAGLKHKPHDLRAATATEMNRAGVSAFVVQRGMRHTNMDTTNHYLVVDVEQVRQGMESLPAIRIPTKANRQPRAA